jgi:anti-sigma regulatory factor (Ser/Thr protein kinase)
VSPASDQDERPHNHSAANDEKTAALSVASLDFVLTADWVAPSLSRSRVRQWLTGHRWSPAHIEDLVMAVSEAVSNSVEHGYGISAEEGHPSTLPDHSRVVEVRAQVRTDTDGARRVEFTIVDHGRWIEPATGRSNRGQGIRMMRACSEEVVIDPDPAGTTVVLRSWPIPTPLGKKPPPL